MMMDFKTQCGMSNVMGAINNTDIAITKPSCAFTEDYFYHKIEGYNIIA